MNEPQAHLSTSSWGIFVYMEPASPVRISSMHLGAKLILTDHHSGYYLLL